MLRRGFLRTGLLTLALAGALALALTGASLASAPTVAIVGHSPSTYAFSPQVLTIDQGTKVRWSWDSNAPHNVTFRKLGEHSKTKAKGSYSLTFAKQGTFHFHCTIHDFKGKVIVK